MSVATLQLPARADGATSAVGVLTASCAGEAVELHAGRALYWPRRRTLFVADVHLGKGAAYRAGGIPVPRGATDAETITVKVNGHDKTGRSDVEMRVVSKKDMQGNLSNVKMKAVTKAKRRLTLSLCGLGWLDETDIETIPDAKPVTLTETGVVVDEHLRKGWAMWGELGVRARAVNVPVPVLDPNITTEDLRAEYAQLLSFVKDAEEQAKE